MDRFEKRIAEIRKRGDVIIAERNRRSSIIKKVSFSVSGLCAAMIVGIGIWHYSALQTPPDRNPIQSNDSFIATTTSHTSGNGSFTAVTTSQTIEKTSATVTSTVSVTAAVPQTSTRKNAQTTAAIITRTTSLTETPKTEQAVTTTVATTIPNKPENENPDDDIDYSKLVHVFRKVDTGIQYTKVTGTLSSKVIDKLIGNQDLYDVPGKGDSSCFSELFSIKDISPEAMIAVRYEGKEDLAIYRNQDYMPKTLGEFTKGLGLDKYAVFDSAEYFDFSRGYKLRSYYGFETDLIIGYLLENADAECFRSTGLLPEEINSRMTLGFELTDILPFHIGLWISEKGYLTTNLTGGGLAFYIGEDRAAEIINNITENYPYSVIYQENDNETDEESITPDMV